MIKIKKSSKIPDVLDAVGNSKLIQERDSNNSLYSSNNVGYDSGTVKMKFDNKIYGHANIKSELIENQNGKCAFCEQHVYSVSYGDVEHFRPKGGYMQDNKDKLHKPGYYWLAYDWFNLLFCCQKCNQRYKKNLFPILNQNNRAKNHNDSIEYEKPIFINPYVENPKFLIRFNEEVAVGKDKKARGRKTIEALQLNRKGKGYSDLIEIRKDHYDLVNQTYKISNMLPNSNVSQADIDKAKSLMKTFRSKRKAFSAMIESNF